MYTTGPDFGLLLLWILHSLGMLAATVGALLLIIWAAKTLTVAQMKQWGLWLFLGGIAVCLLTLLVLPMQRIERHGMMTETTMYGNGGMQQMQDSMGGMNGMHTMMDDDDMMDHDAMSMSMNDMSLMLAGKTGDAFDAAFIEGMIPHHQGAIDMAIAAKSAAKHDEIKTMADAIITAQQQEIDMMKRWQKDWGYSN